MNDLFLLGAMSIRLHCIRSCGAKERIGCGGVACVIGRAVFNLHISQAARNDLILLKMALK